MKRTGSRAKHTGLSSPEWEVPEWPLHTWEMPEGWNTLPEGWDSVPKEWPALDGWEQLKFDNLSKLPQPYAKPKRSKQGKHSKQNKH